MQLCYSGHAAVMGRKCAQRVRADGLTDAGSRLPRRSLRCVLCAAVRHRCCALRHLYPRPAWLACLEQHGAQHARCALSHTDASCRLASAARTTLHLCTHHGATPPFTTRYASQRLWCVITCHAPPSMSACACYPRLRSCNAPSSAVLCPARQVGFPPTLLQAASARHLRGQRHPG